jgi:hypothetical protein
LAIAEGTAGFSPRSTAAAVACDKRGGGVGVAGNARQRFLDASKRPIDRPNCLRMRA